VIKGSGPSPPARLPKLRDRAVVLDATPFLGAPGGAEHALGLGEQDLAMRGEREAPLAAFDELMARHVPDALQGAPRAGEAALVGAVVKHARHAPVGQPSPRLRGRLCVEAERYDRRLGPEIPDRAQRPVETGQDLGLAVALSQQETEVDLPVSCGEQSVHFPGLSLEGDGALEAER
jgi:hypothetical protein